MCAYQQSCSKNCLTIKNTTKVGLKETSTSRHRISGICTEHSTLTDKRFFN